jgi:hypothetical protein
MILRHSRLVASGATVAVILATAAALAGPASATTTHHASTPSRVQGIDHGAPLVRNFVKPNSTSNNWSGYAVTGGRFTSVSASWVQPSGSCTSQTTYASFWIGIDGDGSNSVEQTGSEVDCRGGQPVYYAWYEMYPQYPVNFQKTVRPGDVFTSSITTNGKGSFTMTISDTTQHWSKTVTKKYKPAQLYSAEVIAEAPSSGSGVLPLTNFGTMQFSASDANGSSMAGQNPDEITMQSGSTVKAQPSAMDGSGDFTDTWHHA